MAGRDLLFLETWPSSECMLNPREGVGTAAYTGMFGWKLHFTPSPFSPNHAPFYSSPKLLKITLTGYLKLSHRPAMWFSPSLPPDKIIQELLYRTWTFQFGLI